MNDVSFSKDVYLGVVNLALLSIKGWPVTSLDGARGMADIVQPIIDAVLRRDRNWAEIEPVLRCELQERARLYGNERWLTNVLMASHAIREVSSTPLATLSDQAH